MLSVLVAVLCNTLPGPTYCVEEAVATMPLQICAVKAQLTLAPWMASGKYRDNWRIEKFSCEKADYVVRRPI